MESEYFLPLEHQGLTDHSWSRGDSSHNVEPSECTWATYSWISSYQGQNNYCVRVCVCVCLCACPPQRDMTLWSPAKFAEEHLLHRDSSTWENYRCLCWGPRGQAVWLATLDYLHRYLDCIRLWAGPHWQWGWRKIHDFQRR